MPYESHPNLVTPPDSTVLWRYLDFAKLDDVLERQVLWFARADTFEDPLEGGWTDSENEQLCSLPSVPTPLGNRLIGESYVRGARTGVLVLVLSWFYTVQNNGEPRSARSWQWAFCDDKPAANLQDELTVATSFNFGLE